MHTSYSGATGMFLHIKGTYTIKGKLKLYLCCKTSFLIGPHCQLQCVESKYEVDLAGNNIETNHT